MLATIGRSSTRRLARTFTSTRDELRTLLRETAQPVAVLTCKLKDTEFPYHGATLSSFTSIALEPEPLIAFSLRLPSRMAVSLKETPSMVVNLLSASQVTAAFNFSRPDLFPNPFTSLPFTCSQDDIPILHNALGALSCQLVTTLPLHDQKFLEGRSRTVSDASNATGISELFIARVLRVEKVIRDEQDPVRPLIYYRRGYTSCVSDASQL
ncbi:flavin reductase like domain-containing protein [Mycena floridula]|nr:flavin reductase like domain-containing protein [Mycena floridula]